MQDIDRVAHVERFAEPAWTQRVCVETKPRVLIPRSERAKRIATCLVGPVRRAEAAFGGAASARPLRLGERVKRKLRAASSRHG